MERQEILGLSPVGFHRMVYWEWSAAAIGASTLLAVHGLTRNGRDFDAVARALSNRFRILCPDIVGRGASDRLPNGALYGYPQYLADCAALIARADAQSVDWLGTSMGGLIGLMLAAQPQTPIRRLILNDVGPFVPGAALERIGTYVGQDPRFANLAEGEAYLRRTYAAFGFADDAQWADFTRNSLRSTDDGGFALDYDPAIGAVFQGAMSDVDLWPLWDAVRCPVLILRGGQSDLLTAAIADEMVRRKPAAELVTFPECGHAPALVADHQIAVIGNWLARTE